jgi:hypothetical protein
MALRLPLGTSDAELLLWTEAEDRILVSFDKRTLPDHLADHLTAGHHCPGIFMVSPSHRPVETLEFLVLAAHASEPAEWRDWIKYLG